MGRVTDYTPPEPTIKGRIVHEKTDELGHTAQVEELVVPILRGAGLRTHRLWLDGKPAAGRQWHYCFEDAVEDSEYLFKYGYIERIRWLENRVGRLESELYLLRTNEEGSNVK